MDAITIEMLESAFNKLKQNSGKIQNKLIVSPLDLFYIKEYERDEEYLRRFPRKIRDLKRLKMSIFYRVANKKKKLNLPD